MTKEWFTLREMLEAGIPAHVTSALAGGFGNGARTKTRVRPGLTVLENEAEFSINCMAERWRLQLRAYYTSPEIIARIKKLGIQRKVNRPRGRYVGPDVDKEIAALEAALQLAKAQQAA